MVSGESSVFWLRALALYSIGLERAAYRHPPPPAVVSRPGVVYVGAFFNWFLSTRLPPRRFPGQYSSVCFLIDSDHLLSLRTGDTNTRAWVFIFRCVHLRWSRASATRSARTSLALRSWLFVHVLLALLATPPCSDPWRP
jgi:hypothetical protein